MNKYFVILNCQKPGFFLPLLCENSEDMEFFPSVAKAKEAAEDTVLGKHFGYEIHGVGEGIYSSGG